MIGSWRRVLVLAPHTDDGEFGCGGTMARLVEGGAEVRYVAFSRANYGRSLGHLSALHYSCFGQCFAFFAQMPRRIRYRQTASH